MELNINQQQKNFELESITVQQLLDLERPDKQKGIAVAINQNVIPKSQWEETALKSGDQILIITATQGG